MVPKPSPAEEVLALCERLIEGNLEPADKERLERLVIDDPMARQLYVEYLHLHAGLRALTESPALAMPTPSSPRRRSRLYWLLPAALVVAAGVILVVGRTTAPQTPTTLATLTQTQHARWEGMSLPTAQGARLSAGRLRLFEGLATVVFDSGAKVTLQAPAELELVTRLSCVLHKGLLVAQVPPGANGFTVRSPNAIVIDHGTEFGMSAGANGDTRVEVLSGMVEASHLGAPKRLRLHSGEGAVFQPSGAVAHGGAGASRLEPAAHDPAQQSSVREDVMISSTSGRGQATYIESQTHAPDARSAAVLLVKNTPDREWQRKAYVAFDLAAVAEREIEGASLTLSLVPTSMGFAAFVPDATFKVYGVSVEGLESGWSARELRWQSAPGNAPGGGAVNSAQTTLLGSFAVPQGTSHGAFTVTGPAVAAFANARRGGVATFLVVRETAETRKQGLVHGFAANHHPTAAPPTLRLALAGASALPR